MTSLDSALSRKNFQTLLFGSEKLENLDVGSKGELCYKAPVSWLSWFVGAPVVDTTKRVRLVIEQMLQSIDQERENFSLPNNVKVSEKEVEHVIIDKLCKASNEIFNRSSLYHMNYLQGILVPKLRELRENPKENDSNCRMELALAKAELMFRLRIGIHLNKGATRSIIIRWFDQEEIAIFKPENSNESWDQAILDYFKYQLGMQISHLSTSRMARPRAEVAVHLIDEYLEIGITCPTRIHTFEQTTGSFQLFEHGMVEAGKIRPLLDAKPQFHADEIRYYQQMVILDFLVGDLDGHEENWLIRKGERDSLIADLKKIDNANSFIQRNPTRTYLSDSKQYVWKEWRIAEKPFSEESRALINRLTPKKMEEIIELIRKELPGFMDSDMMQLFRLRAEVLRSLVNMETASPKMLGDLQTDEEIYGFLAEAAPMKSESVETDLGEFLSFDQAE